MHYFTTKQVFLTKRLAACNPIVSQKYRLGGKCISDVLLCSAAKEWGGVLNICDCVCVYLDSKLHQFVIRHCSLINLRRFNTTAYRFTLSGVCRHVRYQHVSSMIRCGHADIEFAYPEDRNNSVMSVQFLPHTLYR
jgi:hypothetical protein